MESPAQPNGFAFAVWVGTIGGAALAVDPDPNTTPPSAGRVVRSGAKKGAVLASQLVARTFFVPIAGGNITIQFWIFDDTYNLWRTIFGTQNSTPNAAGANNQIGLTIGARLNQLCFAQITANANVQAMAFDVI